MRLTLYQEALAVRPLNLEERDCITGRLGEILFFPVDEGDGEGVQCRIVNVWPAKTDFPLLNLEDPKGVIHSSVPHASSVKGANGFFYRVMEQPPT